MSLTGLLNSSSSSTEAVVDSESQPLNAPGEGALSRKSAKSIPYGWIILQNLCPLLGAFICAASFGLCLWAAVEGRAPSWLGSSCAGIVLLMLFFFFASIKCMTTFLTRLADMAIATSEDTNAAMICSAEVTIDSETVLTVRSWWPKHMCMDEVRRHGKRIAISSARRWLAENRQAGKCLKIRFSDDAALSLCRSHVAAPAAACESSPAGVCAVCLEELQSDSSVQMRQCSHLFHDQCLATWFVQSSRLQCPMCRADHCPCVPADLLQAHTVKEEPAISVVSISVEEGFLNSQ